MFQKTVLDSGLTIISETMEHLRSVTLGVWISAGSRHETPAEAGLAHYIEHVTFKGTPTRNPKQIAQEIESVGGILNAMTDKEICAFYAKVLDTHLELAVNLLADIVLNSTYPDEELEREKNVILEEINMYEDDPDEVAMDKFIDGLWKDSSLGRPTIGFKETVTSFKPDHVRAYRKKHYIYSNVTIAAAGNLNHDELVDYVQKEFSKTSLSLSTDIHEPHLPQVQYQQVFTDKPIEQIHFCLGTDSFKRSHPDRYTMTILSAILGGGMSSRLFQEIREKRGLVYGISTYGQSFRDTGMFGVMAGTSPELYEQVKDLITVELLKIAKEPVTVSELQDAKEQLKGHLVLGLESSYSRMMRIAELQIYFGKYIPLDEVIEKFDAVSIDDVQRLSQQFFRPEKLALSVVGPLNKLPKTK